MRIQRKYRAFAFLLSLALPLAAEVPARVCDACHRENLDNSAVCQCGKAFPVERQVSQATLGCTTRPTEIAPSNMLCEAAEDVRHAREVRETNPVAALAMYENALAILSVDLSGKNQAARDRLLHEIASARIARREWLAHHAGNQRAALADELEGVVSYHISLGRKRCGGAWLPLEWLDVLPPARIAAARQAVPVCCSRCAGLGLDGACRPCKGKGFVRCTATGCENGFVTSRPQNSLSSDDALRIRSKCETCGGTANVRCTECGGRKVAVCRICNGDGLAKTCKACHGDGLEICSACARRPAVGVDEPVCGVCKGSKRTLCGKCGGDGRIPK